MQSKRDVLGLTIFEVAVTLAIVTILALLLLPACSRPRTPARKMTNSTQLRGIHQGMVNYAQGHKMNPPAGDGVFPGLAVDLSDFDDGFHAGHNGYGSGGLNGAFAAHRFAVLLNSGFITPEYLINPQDGATKTPVVEGQEVTTANYSYAILQLNSKPRRTEWTERINGLAPIACDRLIGSLSNPSSIWTEVGSGEWEGTVVFNDNSAQFISRTVGDGPKRVPRIETTRYADGPTLQDDHLFIAEGDSDAAMVYSTDSVNEYAK